MSKEKVLYQEKYLTIRFDPQMACLYNDWHSYATSDQFRSASLKMLSLVQGLQAVYPSLKLVADVRKLGMVKTEDAQWAAQEMDPLLFQAGIRKIAFIIPESVFMSISVSSYQQLAQAADQIEVRQFPTAQSARQWVQE